MTLVATAAVLIRPHAPFASPDDDRKSSCPARSPSSRPRSTRTRSRHANTHRMAVRARRSAASARSARAHRVGRSADAYLRKFRGIPARTLCRARCSTKPARSPASFMVRRLRKALAELEEKGTLTNRDLLELWGAYRLSDERSRDEQRLVDEDVMPAHLMLPPELGR